MSDANLLFQVKATWHKSQLLLPVNPPSQVHPNKAAVTHLLAPAAGLCFTTYVLRLGWTKCPGRRNKLMQILAGSPALSWGRAGPGQWRHLMAAARAAGPARGRSRHVPIATAPGPACGSGLPAQGWSQPRDSRGVRSQLESSLEFPWGRLGPEVPRWKVRGSGRFCCVLVQLPGLCQNRSCGAERREHRWSLIDHTENSAELSQWDRALWFPIEESLVPGLWPLNYSPPLRVTCCQSNAAPKGGETFRGCSN